jgi:hypothetical protein
LDASLDVCIDRIVVFNAGQDILSAECVDKGGATWSGMRQSMPLRQVQLLSSPVPDAPHTMMQNWIPFFTFFLRLICGSCQ